MNSLDKKPAVSIVIPVYNSEKSIGPLVDTLILELSTLYNLEIVLVNDNSKDSSKEVCVNLHNKYPEVVGFFSLSKNVGEHNAVMAGVNQTTGDYIVIMDDDFQNPISEVPKMVSHIQENDFDVVYSYYRSKRHSPFRNIGSYFNDRIANLMLGKPKNLYLSSFKVFNRFIANEIIKYDLPFPYIDGLILRITNNIGKVEVKHEKRAEGKSGYTLKKLISLWLNTFTSFSVLPLRASIILGFIFAIFGFCLAVYTVKEKLLNPHLPIGYSALITTISIFSGIQLLAIGTLGEYLGRIFIAISRKPQFTIKDAFPKKTEDSELKNP